MTKHLLWAMAALLLSGVSGVTVHYVERLRCGKTMSDQAQRFASIVNETDRIDHQLARIAQQLSVVAHDAEERRGAGEAEIKGRSDISAAAHALLRQALTELANSGSLPQAIQQRDLLQERFTQFHQSLADAKTEYQDYYRAYLQTIANLTKRIAQLKRETYEKVKLYQTMLKEIGEFLQLPVELDFDPNPDIENIHKKIKEAETLLKKLAVVEQQLKRARQEIEQAGFQAAN